MRNNTHHTRFCLFAGSCKPKNHEQHPPKWHHEEVEGPSWDTIHTCTQRWLPHNVLIHKWIHTAQIFCLYNIRSYPCPGFTVWFCPGSVNPLLRVDVIRYPLTGQWQPTTTHTLDSRTPLLSLERIMLFPPNQFWKFFSCTWWTCTTEYTIPQWNVKITRPGKPCMPTAHPNTSQRLHIWINPANSSQRGWQRQYSWWWHHSCSWKGRVYFHTGLWYI